MKSLCIPLVSPSLPPPPLFASASSASPSHPSLTSIDFLHSSTPRKDVQISKYAQHATHKSRQIRTKTGQKCGDGQYLLIHRTHSVYDHRLPTFFEAESAHFQSANTTRVVAQIPRHNQLPTSWIAERLPGKLRALERSGDHLEAYQFTPKTGDQDVQLVRCCYKNANVYASINMRARANLTNHGLRRCRGTFTRGLGGEGGRTKLEYPVLHALARSEPDDVKLNENTQLKTTY